MIRRGMADDFPEDDDDHGQRSLLETFLRERGYQTQSAASGEAALAMLEGGSFAMMISDVRMPGSGSASISHIQLKDRTRNGGGNEQFGEGDTPIKDVLGVIKAKALPIPVFVEYGYLGLGTPLEEVRKCMAYVKAALAG